MRPIARLPLFLLFLLLCLTATTAAALPRYTLSAGSRCSNCHVNPQGGGLRSGSGWYMMNTASNGMITWDKLGLESVHKAESNTFLDNRLTIGGDFRLQAARLGRPTADATGAVKLPDFMWIPMQSSPGVDVKVANTVHVAASVNLAGIYYEQVMDSKIYPGQSNYDAWIRWTPAREAPAEAPSTPAAQVTSTTSEEDEFDAPAPAEFKAPEPPVGLPSVRVGMLQPSFGIRHDDHTLLIRSSSANLRQPVLPAFYNDLGGEVSWEGIHWLSVEAGAFWPRNFSEARFGTTPSAKKDDATQKPLASARVTFWPRIDSVGLNFWAGASALYTPSFHMEGTHLGIGKTYWGSLFLEGSMSRDETQALTRRAWMVQLDYPIVDWISVGARFEQAHAESDTGTVTDAQAVVASVQWKPLPMIELRPEYRYLDTTLYRMAQYTLQVHLFY